MGFFGEVLSAIFGGSGFAALPTDWRQVVMLVIACILLYMGIGKGFEPLLLVPIAFGMLLANLPLTGLLNEPSGSSVGFMWVLYQGVNYAIYPSIIFMGIGAMTDFGPLLANPMSLLLGAAAQLGIRVPAGPGSGSCHRRPDFLHACPGCRHRRHRRRGRPHRHPDVF